MQAPRNYPIGIQTFSEIRKNGYVYIDKTELMWEMTRMKYVFLSRPRRFGKSLLTTTLDSYFNKDDIEAAMNELKTFLAGIPYVEGFQNKLKEVKNYEGFYEYTFWLIFNMLNVFAQTQVKCAGGRVDFVVWMPETTYVFELKLNGTAQQALNQINSKGYALPYQTEGKSVVKIGVQFNHDTMTIEDYLIEK